MSTLNISGRYQLIAVDGEKEEIELDLAKSGANPTMYFCSVLIKSRLRGRINLVGSKLRGKLTPSRIRANAEPPKLERMFVDNLESGFEVKHNPEKKYLVLESGDHLWEFEEKKDDLN